MGTLTEVPAALSAALEAGQAVAAARRVEGDLRARAAAYPGLFPVPPFEPALFGSLALACSFGAPWATPAELRITSRTALWVFAADWIVDVQARRPDEVELVRARSLAVLSGAHPTDDLSRFLAEIAGELSGRPAFAQLGPAWTDEVDRMLAAMRREWTWKSTAVRPSFEDYIDNADNFGSAFVNLTYWLFAGEADTVARIDELRTASRAVQRVLRLVNDLQTHGRDLTWGDLNSLMLGLSRADVEARVAVELDGCRILLDALAADLPRSAAYLNRQLGFSLGFYRDADYWGALPDREVAPGPAVGAAVRGRGGRATAGGAAGGRAPGGAAAVTAGVAALMAGLRQRPWGEASSSVYETGRLVALAPWLPGHRERLRFLLDHQRVDGSWGPPEYALVPTLSATDALLAAAATPSGPAEPSGAEPSGAEASGASPSGASPSGGELTRDELARAARRGLDWLAGTLTVTMADDLPDLPAIELILPALVESINARLRAARRRRDRSARTLTLKSAAPLVLPAGATSAALVGFRRLVGHGADVPVKLLHALEVAGEVGRLAPGVHPAADSGTVGASPAATAAWLGGREGERAGAPVPSRRVATEAARARRFLDQVIAETGGPVPCGVPIGMFERAWVAATLGRAGLGGSVTAEVTDSIAAALRRDGMPAGEGLPADADTTAVAVFALAKLGRRSDPAPLFGFRSGIHFSTWPGEQGVSVSVNAHVLEAFREHLRRSPRAGARYLDAAADLAGWLHTCQRGDGSFIDRWHASPYYATHACVTALHGVSATDPEGRSTPRRTGAKDAARKAAWAAATASVSGAVDWVLATQHPDGSWGRWAGSAEETAYALQILLTVRRPGRAVATAVTRGHRYLVGTDGGPDEPALWIDKDLYYPHAIVRANVLAALHLVRTARHRRTAA